MPKKKDLSPELPNSNRAKFLVSASSTVAAGRGSRPMRLQMAGVWGRRREYSRTYGWSCH